MKLAFFSGKNVALLGAGKDNLSLIHHLKKVGASITLLEQNLTDFSHLEDVTTVTGGRYLDSLAEFDIIVRSPGIGHWQVKEMISGSKTPMITTAVDIFLDNAPCPIIGVTGTKGKGTTSTMIGQILKASSRDARVLGNIGETVFGAYDELTQNSIVVAELSSFMLEDITAGPKYAVVLAITPDHLQPLSKRSPNYHRSFEEYAKAKSNIVRFLPKDGIAVFNEDNQTSREIGVNSPAIKVSVSTQNRDATYYLDQQAKIIHRGDIKLIDFNQTTLTGDHVRLNALYAVALSDQLGIESDMILEGLKSFKPLPHRLETFYQKDGVTYVDDSFATAPDATIAALSAFPGPVVLIAGGISKGADFKELGKVISQKVKTLIVIGQEAERITQAVRSFSPTFPVSACVSLEVATEQAIQSAKSGDTVLLSPACASTDMFENASERGRLFQDYILAKA